MECIILGITIGAIFGIVDAVCIFYGEYEDCPIAVLVVVGCIIGAVIGGIVGFEIGKILCYIE